MLLVSGHLAYALLILCCITAGAVSWMLVVRWSRRHPGETDIIRFLFMAGLVLRVGYAMLNPTFNSPDEEAHYNYVRYLDEHHHLAVQTTTTNAPTKDWEYHQAPLYYVALWPLYHVLSRLTDQTHVIVVGLRFVSVLFWWLMAAAVLRLLNRLEIRDSFVRVFTVAMVCLLPAWVTLSSSMNNDIPFCMLAALVIERLAAELSYRTALLIGLWVGAALLTKVTALLLLPAVALMIVARVWSGAAGLGRSAVGAAMLFAVAAVLWSPVVAWNVKAYGHPLGMGETIAETRRVYASPLAAFEETQEYLKESFWTAGGIYAKARFFPSVGIHLSYLALLGLFIGFVKRGVPFWDLYSTTTRRTLFALGIAVALDLAVIFITYQASHGHGRFLFPLLGPIAILLATGLCVLGIRKLPSSSSHAAGFFTAYSVAAVLYSFVFFAHTLRLPWYPILG